MIVCEYGEVDCGALYDCGKCARKKRAKAFARLTPEQKEYDRMVDPLRAYHTDFPAGCSCHISPPCSVCVGSNEEESKNG